MNQQLDTASLPLGELRAMRAQLQSDDDALSYVRRIVQTRLDFIAAELKHRAGGTPHQHSDLPDVLRSNLQSGTPRPPRPAEEASGHPLAIELDQICSHLGANRLAELTKPEVLTLQKALKKFEEARSHERRELFDRLDLLSAELVRRYRSGEASVDGLLSDD